MHNCIPKRQIYTKSLSIGIPVQPTLEFIRLYTLWTEQSGVNWTVQRLKSLKTDLINSYAQGTRPISQWVAKDKKGNFKGVIGTLFKYAHQSRRCFTKVLTLFNIYTAHTFETPSPKDDEKFIKAVTTKGVNTPKWYLSCVEQAAYHFRTDQEISPASRFDLQPYTTETREHRYMREPVSFFSTEEGINTIKEYYDVFGESMMGVWGFRGPRWTGNIPYIGRIYCHGNPGLKARYYASPHLWLQHVLSPLGKAVYSKVSTLPWDCTFDQEKPDKVITDHLANNKMCYCFDLSSATDRFPFDLQITALKSIFSHKDAQRHIEFYQYIQAFPYEYNGEPLVWARGQALGMYPSFGTFTLTHGLLIYGLNNFHHDNKFFVLGDDVIILDNKLAKDYEQFLTMTDIPFAKEKTVQSSRLAEFAGKMYHSDKVSRIPKWKPMNRQNIIEQVRQWGPSIIELLPRKYRNIMSKIIALPSPWGADINPKGLSLDNRFKGFEDILCPENKELGFATNIRQTVMNRHIHGSDLTTLGNLYGSLKLVEKYDQYLSTLLDYYGIGFLHPHIAGKNLYQINSDIDLPIEGLVSGTISSREWSKSVSRFFKLNPDLDPERL